MERFAAEIISDCPSPEISAYIDGELSPSDQLEMEGHLAGCSACSVELNAQKSFLNALDLSLEDKTQIELPAHFTRAVVANAESSVLGLRRPSERRSAFLICAGLIVLSMFALGSNADKTFAATAAIAEKGFAVAASAGHFVYDVALGSTIVIRSLASSFVFESSAVVSLLLIVFFLSLYFFSRLLIRYHRT